MPEAMQRRCPLGPSPVSYTSCIVRTERQRKGLVKAFGERPYFISLEPENRRIDLMSIHDVPYRLSYNNAPSAREHSDGSGAMMSTVNVARRGPPALSSTPTVLQSDGEDSVGAEVAQCGSL